MISQLFARFGKGETQTGGVGLGLAIAKKIADTGKDSLTYHYTDGQYQFVLRFSRRQVDGSSPGKHGFSPVRDKNQS